MFNLKSKVLGAAAVLPVVAAGLMASAGSAQAAALNGSLTLNGTAGTFSNALNPNTTTFSFVDVDGVDAHGDFGYLTPALDSGTNPITGITINTLNLTKIADRPDLGPRYATYSTGNVNPWINFGQRTLNGVTNLLTFNLNNTQVLRNTVGSNGVSLVTLEGLTGSFIFGTETLGNGFLSGSRSGAANSYEITLEAQPVPEPTTMLGLGLVAAGMTVASRRKAVKA